MNNYIMNKKTATGIYYSQYIVSWTDACNAENQDVIFDGMFSLWLKTNGCTDNEIRDICKMVQCGKYELRQDAKNFLSRRKQLSDEDFKNYIKEKEDDLKINSLTKSIMRIVDPYNDEEDEQDE